MERAPIRPLSDVDLADLPLPVVLHINSVADDFESAWQSGERPELDSFIDGAEKGQRAVLLRQLILLDADYRRDGGETPKPDDYLLRFPELDGDWLAQALSDGCVPAAPAAMLQRAHSGVATLPSRFGDYELLAEAGRGGMGVVFRARHIRLNRIVALKMILAGRLADTAHIDRFYTEARAAARLQHPGIVPVYEVGEHDGQHFLAMAFVEGSDLGELVRDGPLPAAEAAKIIQAAAEAADFAHGQGVIHRDLKPQNILIDQAGRPHITDFGLAKDARRNRASTTVGMILGTPTYMAPEQGNGRPENIGPTADVYSLGATLYHLLAGQPPFRATVPIETLHQLIDREPIPPRSLNPAIPKDLETICLACLRKDPQRRYHSAGALANDLQRWLNCEPIRARSVTRRERVWLWCRRKPAIAGLMVTLFAIVLGAIGVGVEAYRRHRAETLVEQLLAADTAEVPQIAEQLGRYGGRAAPLLHEAFAAAEVSGDAKTQLHAALVLKEFERGQVDFLRDRAVAVFERADGLARRGEWKRAADSLDCAIAMCPHYPDWLHRSAILKLYIGDIDGYRQRCREIVDIFGATDQPELAHKIALALLATPDPDGPDLLIELAQVAARSGNAAHVRSLAAAYYRVGRFAEARQLLERVAAVQAGGYSQANTQFFLAMAHHRLGDADHARRHLREAVTAFERAAAGNKSGNYGRFWRRWMIISLVRREAEALIQPADPHSSGGWPPRLQSRAMLETVRFSAPFRNLKTISF